MKKLFISIINYNSENETRACLQSLSQCVTDGLELHVLVIDNHSKDGFSLQTNDFPKLLLSVIKNTSNEGFAAGHNKGISIGLKDNADYIMILNNDTVVDKHMLMKLVSALEVNERIGMVAPKIYFAKGSEFHKARYTKEELGKVFWYAGGYTDWDNVRSIHRGVDEVDHGQYNKTEAVEFISGCCMLIKREVFDKTGFMNEKYFLYYEDADFNERVKRAGYSLYYVPDAFLYHMNASSSGGAGNNLQDYFITRNRMIFGMRYAPLRTKLALIRESLQLLKNGRPYQKKGIKDFYFRRFGQGTYFTRV